MACVRDNKAGGLLGKKVSPRLMPPSEGGEKEYKLEELFQSSNGDYDIQKTHPGFHSQTGLIYFRFNSDLFHASYTIRSLLSFT